MPRPLLLLVLLVLVQPTTGADEKVFSGPQVGEKLPSFKVRGVYDAAGKEIDFVKQAAGKPIVLIFVHVANRPSIGMTRVLGTYTTSLAKDGLTTGVVWLSGDPTEAESKLKTIRHAMPKAPTGISVDGKEGPGSYGLNRKMELTILVGKGSKVTANFALVQPSIQADLPKILAAVAKVTGGKAPKLEDLPGVAGMLPAAKMPDMRALVTPLIRLKATPAEVDKAAANIEAAIKKNPAVGKEIGRISRTIVGSGKLENYGTPRAQEYLRQWAKKYGEAPPRKKDRGREEKP